MDGSGNGIRIRHLELLDTVTRHTERLCAHASEADLELLARWLKGDLLGHVEAEEKHLYPAVEPLIKAYGQATATMQLDHRIIEDYVRDICVIAEALLIAGPSERASLDRLLQRLMTRLEGILRLHFEKEDDIYVPLIERYLSRERQIAVLKEIQTLCVEPARRRAQ